MRQPVITGIIVINLAFYFVGCVFAVPVVAAVAAAAAAAAAAIVVIFIPSFSFPRLSSTGSPRFTSSSSPVPIFSSGCCCCCCCSSSSSSWWRNLNRAIIATAPTATDAAVAAAVAVAATDTDRQEQSVITSAVVSNYTYTPSRAVFFLSFSFRLSYSGNLPGSSRRSDLWGSHLSRLCYSPGCCCCCCCCCCCWWWIAGAASSKNDFTHTHTPGASCLFFR